MSGSHVLSGIHWSLATSVIRRLVTLVLFYFVARWLSQSDLGVFREYCLILAFLSLISCLSINAYYVIEQRKQLTALIAMLQITVIAAVLGLVLLIPSAGLLGRLYQSEVLGRLLTYTSVFLVIEILRRTVRSVAIKLLQFRELALAETYNVFVYSFLAIAALYFYRSVWVYVIAFFIGNGFETIYLYAINRNRINKAIRRSFSERKILCLTVSLQRRFLSQATLVSIVNVFSGNAPILILGMLISPDYIGLFFFASQAIGVPVGMFTTAINQVFFPVFSGKSDGDISGMAWRFVKLVSYLGLPLLLLYSFIMAYLVRWLFGTKWIDALPLIPAMFILYGSGLYTSPISGIPFVKKKPDWELIWNVLGFIIRVGAMLLALKASFLASIWAYTIASVAVNIAFYLMSMYLVKIAVRDTLLHVLTGALPVLAYAALLFVVKGLNPGLAIGSAVLGCGLLLALTDYFTGGRLRAEIKLLSGSRKG